MAQTRFDPTVASFTLSSQYNCVTVDKSYFSAAYSLVDSEWPAAEYTSSPGRAEREVTFAHELPNGAEIKSAKVYATIGPSTYGTKTLTINGVTVSTNSTAVVDVTVDPKASSVTVTFAFVSRAVFHTHKQSTDSTVTKTDSWVYNDPNNNNCHVLTETHTKTHTGVVTFSGIYLLIETEGGSGYIYRAESGNLAPYQLCRAEGGKLVPYQLHRAEGGKLVPY